MPPKRRANAKKAAAKPVAKVEPEKEEVVEEQTPEVEPVENMEVDNSIENDEDDNEPEEEEAEEKAEESPKKEKKEREIVPVSKLHSYEELGFFAQRHIANTFKNANKHIRNKKGQRFPKFKFMKRQQGRGKRINAKDKLTADERVLWHKFQNNMLLDAVVVWGEKLNYKVCSGIVLSTHCKSMQDSIVKCRENVVKGRDAFPENMHACVLKVHDDLSHGIIHVLNWMHTGELLLKKQNFQSIMECAIALRVSVLAKKLRELAKDYGFHWVELPESEKAKEAKAKREKRLAEKKAAKEAKENGVEEGDEDAEDEEDAEDNTEEDAEEETKEEEAEKEEQVNEEEIDPSLTKIGGQELLDKIKGMRGVRYFTELPEESFAYRQNVCKWTGKSYGKKAGTNAKAGEKRKNENSRDDNKKAKTNSATPKKEWNSRTNSRNGRQVKMEAPQQPATQSIYRAQPGPQVYQAPPVYQQPQAAYYGQPQVQQYPQYQYPGQPQQYQAPQPTWRNQGRRY